MAGKTNIMKKVFLISTILFGQFIFGQKYLDTLYNFKIENGELIWQKVFSSENDNVKDLFIKSVVTNIKKKDLQELDKTISFEVIGDEVDFKKYGGEMG